MVNYALNEHEPHLVSATGTLSKVGIRSIFALSYRGVFLDTFSTIGSKRALL